MNRVERFVDTAYWLAILGSRDRYHARALALSDEVSGPLVTTDAVIFEVANALSRPPWRELAIDFLHNVETDPNPTIVRLTPTLYECTVSLYAARADKSWGLTDCLSFVIMGDRGIREALTADHDFEQAGFRALLAQ